MHRKHTGDAPTLDDPYDDRYVVAGTSAASYVFRSPNALNPPLDMRRQEFGPFVRGARFGD